MKLTKVFGLILLFAVVCLAQSDTANTKNEIKWTRIETKNKDFSVSFPPGFLIDAEAKNTGQKTHIIGFQNGAVMNLTIYEVNNSAERLESLRPDANVKIANFKSNGFTGKSIVSNENKFSTSIYLAFEKNYYYLSVSGENEQTPEIGRFLYSIKINGQPLFVQKTPNASAEEVISVLSLKTSNEVSEALKRKSENVKISYDLDSAKNKSPGEETKYSRPPIILFQPFPEPDRNAVPLKRFMNDKPQVLSLKTRLTLLSNGQIGEITILSSPPDYLTETYKRNILDSISRIKFLPAQINGKNVDSLAETETRFISF